MKSLQEPLEALINQAKTNVESKKYPFSLANPILSLLQSMADWSLISEKE